MRSQPVDPTLSKWWHQYKETFITAEGRVRRPRNNDDTVSEGQAYAMLAAVFANDQATFDKLFGWTDANLSRRHTPANDHLLAWHWEEGRVSDWMPASDADCDLAMALILAAKQWGDNNYLVYAEDLISSIMSKETAVGPGGRLLLLPGLWGREKDGSVMQNPSYYSPAAFRWFHRLTDDPRWLELVETSYWVWERSSKLLGGMKGVGLQPDWCLLQSDGTFTPALQRSSDYGWEAVRMPMRIGMDHLWFGVDRGVKLIRKGVRKRTKSDRAPRAVYTYQGKEAVTYDSLAALAMASLVRSLVNEKQSTLDGQFIEALFATPNHDDYYSQSLCWFPLVVRSEVVMLCEARFSNKSD